jgi:2-aminoadipate transaminase
LRLQQQSRERGLEFTPGTAFFYGGGGRQNIRLSYSYVSDEEMTRGVQILSELIREDARR